MSRDWSSPGLSKTEMAHDIAPKLRQIRIAAVTRIRSSPRAADVPTGLRT
jgi:hypothetical protein